MRDEAGLDGRLAELLDDEVVLFVVEEGGEEGGEGEVGWVGDFVEQLEGVVEEVGGGVVEEDAGEEALGLGGFRVGSLGEEDPVDEVGAAEAGELVEGEGVEGAGGVETGEVGGGLEEGGDAIGVGFGLDGGEEAG